MLGVRHADNFSAALTGKCVPSVACAVRGKY
jgi:hypothetical protein